MLLFQSNLGQNVDSGQCAVCWFGCLRASLMLVINMHPVGTLTQTHTHTYTHTLFFSFSINTCRHVLRCVNFVFSIQKSSVCMYMCVCVCLCVCVCVTSSYQWIRNSVTTQLLNDSYPQIFAKLGGSTTLTALSQRYQRRYWRSKVDQHLTSPVSNNDVISPYYFYCETSIHSHRQTWGVWKLC